MPSPSPSDITNGKIYCDHSKCQTYTWHKVVDAQELRLQCLGKCHTQKTSGDYPASVTEATEGHRERASANIGARPQEQFV